MFEHRSFIVAYPTLPDGICIKIMDQEELGSFVVQHPNLPFKCILVEVFHEGGYSRPEVEIAEVNPQASVREVIDLSWR